MTVSQTAWPRGHRLQQPPDRPSAFGIAVPDRSWPGKLVGGRSGTDCSGQPRRLAACWQDGRGGWPGGLRARRGHQQQWELATADKHAAMFVKGGVTAPDEPRASAARLRMLPGDRVGPLGRDGDCPALGSAVMPAAASDKARVTVARAQPVRWTVVPPGQVHSRPNLALFATRPPSLEQEAGRAAAPLVTERGAGAQRRLGVVPPVGGDHPPVGSDRAVVRVKERAELLYATISARASPCRRPDTVRSVSGGLLRASLRSGVPEPGSASVPARAGVVTPTILPIPHSTNTWVGRGSAPTKYRAGRVDGRPDEAERGGTLVSRSRARSPGQGARP